MDGGMNRALLAVGLLAVIPSTGGGKAPKPTAVAPADWRALATRNDLARLRTWREAFVEGLTQAQSGGNTAAIANEGTLLEPDAALDGPGILPGSYRCRTLKLGSAGGAGLAFVSYPAFACRISLSGGVTTLEKITGSQRPIGRLYPGGARRQIFLGTLVLGDETRPMGYGRDANRDIVGAVERIGPQRWRLVMPYPRFESTLDVMELVPAS
jgi:hypothetical protein